jgi:hypothetical protein
VNRASAVVVTVQSPFAATFPSIPSINTASPVARPWGIEVVSSIGAVLLAAETDSHWGTGTFSAVARLTSDEFASRLNGRLSMTSPRSWCSNRSAGTAGVPAASIAARVHPKPTRRPFATAGVSANRVPGCGEGVRGGR